MVIIDTILWLFLAFLFLCSIFPTFAYFRLKKFYDRYPIVAAKIIHSELLDYNDVDGRRVWEADIKYTYHFRGQDYEGSTPALRGHQLFSPNWDFESQLVDEHKVGDYVNVRVVPACPELAYITIAPFSFWSAIAAPFYIIVFGALLFGVKFLYVEFFKLFQ